MGSSDEKKQYSFDVWPEVREFRQQVGSDKRRISFLFGSGTSQAAGLPGIDKLTENVASSLQTNEREVFERLRKSAGPSANVESILNTVRLCKELADSNSSLKVTGLTAELAVTMDRSICRSICEQVAVDPPGGLTSHIEFARWIGSVRRDFPVELFTTNYDLLLEHGLEYADVPHFDGFVGSVEPGFDSRYVDTGSQPASPENTLPRSWVRVWKLHGSIGWRAATNPATKDRRIIRRPSVPPGPAEDLMIFPSREKYMESQKLPFVAYHDRLRSLLCSGEVLLVVMGYSFRDAHVNETILRALRSNNRLSVAVLSYVPIDDEDLRKGLLDPSVGCRNVSVFGPKCAVIGGVKGNWAPVDGSGGAAMAPWGIWNAETQSLQIGDFSLFAQFLKVS